MRHIFSGLRAAGWWLSLVACVFAGVLDDSMMIGAGAGVLVGVWGADWVESRLGGRLGWGRRVVLCLCGFGLLFGVSVWRNAFSFVHPSVAHGIAWLIAAFGYALGLEALRGVGVLGRWAGLAIFLFGTLRMISPSTMGHLERPYWMVERMLEAGWSPDRFWLLAGCCLLVFSVALMGNVVSWGATASGRGGAVRMLGWLALAFGIYQLAPSPSKIPVEDPPLPRAPDSPPPPPPPRKVAVVRFSDFCRPSEFTDYAYLFRVSDQDTGEFEKMAGEKIRKADFTASVMLFSKGEPVPVLVGSEAMTALARFDTSRYEEAWEASVRFPLSVDEDHSRLMMPAERALSKVEEVLWRGVFEEEMIRPIKAAERIKSALESVGKLSEKAKIADEQWSLERFVLENTTGGSENFSRAATELLNLCGLEARSVSGYRYDPGTKGGFKFKELILLSESHRSNWVEWRVLGGVWRPLVVHPKEVLDEKPAPVQEEDLENLLTKEVAKPGSRSAGENTQAQGGGWIVLMCAGIGLAWLLGRVHALFAGEEPEAVVFRWMVRLLRWAGYECQRGQGYSEFEESLGSHSLDRRGREWTVICGEFRRVRRSLQELRWRDEPRHPDLMKGVVGMDYSRREALGFAKFVVALGWGVFRRIINFLDAKLVGDSAVKLKK